MNTNQTALDSLKGEHRVIERVLDALDFYASALSRGEDVMRSDLSLFIRFFEQFADAKHHAKEEDILFAAMIEEGFPRETGPIACMVQEHDEGRGLVKALTECADAESWSLDVITKIAATSSEFAEMLRSHIYKEDNVLYEMARGQLSSERTTQIDLLCAKLDEENVAAGITADLLSLADDLTRRYDGRQAQD